MDLFESSAEDALSSSAPLAARMRPKSVADVVGQSHLIGPGRPLTALLESGTTASLILWGPPGTGKTTIARLLAEASGAEWVQLSATSATVADVRAEISAARSRLGERGVRTLLFLDEIHRFNKAQQDSLLQSVEEGILWLVGATTENPYFEVNAPLLSRSLLFRLEPLDPGDLEKLVRRALADENLAANEIDPGASSHLIALASGDARHLMNAVEWSALLAARAGRRRISLDDVESAGQARLVRYDRSGDEHYDVISAFIKSMRGSHPDAALHWLARMLEAGEDARFIVRRMIVFASEDIGNADPAALGVAVSAAQALEHVGLPEARINLAQAVTYLSQAPKSNASYVAIQSALDDVRQIGGGPVPAHLRDASYRGAADLGHGSGYRYPHDYEDALVSQDYMPESLRSQEYYRPKSAGFEKEIAERMAERKKQLGERATREKEPGGGDNRE